MSFDLSIRRPVGRTTLSLPPMGLGAAHLGGMYNRVDGVLARQTLQAGWDGGIRYYDTAPYYGLGLSEHRLGDFLLDQPRDQFLVTTKVGRVLHRPGNPKTFDRGSWTYGLNFEIEWNYTYDGFMRSYEQSLIRLGLDTVDALIIHDLDVLAAHGEHHAQRLRDLTESGVKALEELKRSGQIKAIGMGLNVTEALDTIASSVAIDFGIVAMPYTLLDQSSLAGMQRFAERGVSVIIGAPYASGILATGPGPNARYRYGIASDEVQDRVRRIQAVCARHGVSLQAAALQFPLAHPAVVSIIPGSAKPSEVASNIAFLKESIPAAFWAELKHDGLIDAEAPTGS